METAYYKWSNQAYEWEELFLGVYVDAATKECMLDQIEAMVLGEDEV